VDELVSIPDEMVEKTQNGWFSKKGYENRINN